MNCKITLRRLHLVAFLVLWLPMAQVGADPSTAIKDRTSASEIQAAYSDSVNLEILHRLAFEALKTSYPDLALRYEQGSLILNDGSKFVFDDGRSKTAQQLLDDPDIFDMFVYAYPLRGRKVLEAGPLIASPAMKLPSAIPYLEDPGRVRVEGFFRQVYGTSAEAVKQKLIPVKWIPSGKGPLLQITSVNGVAQALQRVSDELDKKPELWPYLLRPGGSFNWRVVAGTDRLSVHSFGAAVDINVALSDYWHDIEKDEAAKVVYRNRIPAEIVEVFEKNGFIWGGWWYHFDTMHFEYRPELMEYARLVASAYHKN
jgi:peptidoglycan LD-endopeptidase CwlK